MPNLPIATKSITLTDFDFSVGKSRLTSSEPHDGSVTIRMPGKNRKTANHELVFIPYFKKYKLKFKTVAVGKNKKKMQAPIVVFDQHTLGQQNATIRKYEKIGGIVNSKGHALKILDIFKIDAPDRSDEVLKVYFRLHPTQVNQNKLNYRICHLSLMKVIKDESKIEARIIKKHKKRKKAVPPAANSTTSSVQEQPTSNNIL